MKMILLLGVLFVQPISSFALDLGECTFARSFSVVKVQSRGEHNNDPNLGKRYKVKIQTSPTDSQTAVLSISPNLYGSTQFIVKMDLQGYTMDYLECNGHSTDGNLSIHYHRADPFSHNDNEEILWIKDAPEWYNPSDKIYDTYKKL